MVTNNMWGGLEDVETVRTPTAILRGQAEMLGKVTNKLLEGEVDVRTTGASLFYVDLNVIVPNLENYSYTVLTVKHSILIYPLEIVKTVDGEDYECDNEEEFLRDLGTILSSKEMRGVISALLSQAKGT